jgi:hypothetical protein
MVMVMVVVMMLMVTIIATDRYDPVLN